MRGRRFAAAVALVALFAACGGSQKAAERSEPVIAIHCPVSQATVIINGRELGSVRSLRRGIRLSPGKHRLEVRHPDYHTYYELLDLAPRERRVIDVELAERLP